MNKEIMEKRRLKIMKQQNEILKLIMDKQKMSDDICSIEQEDIDVKNALIEIRKRQKNKF